MAKSTTGQTMIYKTLHYTGADPGEGGHTWRAHPLELEKIWFSGVKSLFFTPNTKKKIRASLRSVQFF